MSDVEVPYGDNTHDTAVLLLEAAQRLGYEASVVRTSAKGMFYVPQEVKDTAFPSEASAPETQEEPTKPKPKPKKAPAKKAAAKKAPAKKSAKKQEN